MCCHLVSASFICRSREGLVYLGNFHPIPALRAHLLSCTGQPLSRTLSAQSVPLKVSSSNSACVLGKFLTKLGLSGVLSMYHQIRDQKIVGSFIVLIFPQIQFFGFSTLHEVCLLLIVLQMWIMMTDALIEIALLSVLTGVYINSPSTEEPDSAVPLLAI